MFSTHLTHVYRAVAAVAAQSVVVAVVQDSWMHGKLLEHRFAACSLGAASTAVRAGVTYCYLGIAI